MDHELQSKLKLKRNLKWLLLFFGIVVAICVAINYFYLNHISSFVTWQEKEISGNLHLELKDRQFSVYDSEGNCKFTSDKKIKVQDALLTDLDGNGRDEIIALVWKKGLYGKHRPFWVSRDEKNYSQHIFIYEVDQNGEVKEKWFASEIGLKVKGISLLESNNSIVVTETTNGDKYLWRWESFGLKNVDIKQK
jgi:hypothetical protein